MDRSTGNQAGRQLLKAPPQKSRWQKLLQAHQSCVGCKARQCASPYCCATWNGIGTKEKLSTDNCKLMALLSQALKHSLVSLIQVYRNMVRPWLQPCCKFVPSCSEYARLCLCQQPLHRALYLITRRILSCNPLVSGGLDLSYKPTLEAQHEDN